MYRHIMLWYHNKSLRFLRDISIAERFPTLIPPPWNYTHLPVRIRKTSPTPLYKRRKGWFCLKQGFLLYKSTQTGTITTGTNPVTTH